jgi:hypothetical protein
MESAKRASVVIIVWNLNFSFFLKRGEARGKEVKKLKTCKRKRLPPPKTTKSAIQKKKVKRIFHFSFTRDRRPIYDAHFALSNTHTHTHALRE